MKRLTSNIALSLFLVLVSPEIGAEQKANSNLTCLTETTVEMVKNTTENGGDILKFAGFNLQLSPEDFYSIAPGTTTGMYQMKMPDGKIHQGQLPRTALIKLLTPDGKGGFKIKEDFKAITVDGKKKRIFTNPIEYARWASKIEVGSSAVPLCNGGAVILSEVGYN